MRCRRRPPLPRHDCIDKRTIYIWVDGTLHFPPSTITTHLHLVPQQRPNMASNKPAQCCTVGVKHEGKAMGEIKDISGSQSRHLLRFQHES